MNSEPSLAQKAVMLLKTLASTIAWIVALVAELVRCRFQGRTAEK